MKAISLFTGAGGLDLGFEAAGIETAVAVEMDAESVATLAANRAWPVIPRDIHTVSSSEILETAGLDVGEADILIGGPPCQPFSKSGFWASGETLRLEDPRAGTLVAYLRVLRDTQPRAFLLENVEGIAYKGKNEALHLLRRSLEKINQEIGTSYRFEIARLNAADYGVPQLRKRVFIIGSREGTPFRFPEPTHAAESESSHNGLRPYTRAWDAIGDLQIQVTEELEVGGRYADVLPSIPEGENYLWHTPRGGGQPLWGWRRRYWNFLLKLAKALPSWTIQAQPGPSTGPFHWDNRRLAREELAALQTFPTGYTVTGDLRAAQRQIGNAVPSALAEVLAREMKAQLLNGRRKVNLPALIPQRKVSVPPPEPTGPVPPRFLALAGNHAPHPGTGKGPSAAARES